MYTHMYTKGHFILASSLLAYLHVFGRTRQAKGSEYRYRECMQINFKQTVSQAHDQARYPETMRRQQYLLPTESFLSQSLHTFGHILYIFKHLITEHPIPEPWICIQLALLFCYNYAQSSKKGISLDLGLWQDMPT